MASIGENIRKLRKARGLTQEQLAELTGINEKSISFYENGSRNVPSDCLFPFADALGVSVEVILGREKLTELDELMAKIHSAVLDVLKDYKIAMK